jgi:hypothetical protein
MTLSNAERQARYRERLKQLAARGVMTPIQAQLLADTRKRLRECRRSLAAFAEGRMWLRVNSVDRTAEHAGMLRGMIATNEALIAEYDPDGLTADGNIEIGDVSPQESVGVLPGRWVSYALDDHGNAVNLRVYDVESLARSDALQSNRDVGIVADDLWSITPAPNQVGYALVQEMPNGWWRALISGWSDLPEQYELSRDRVISEIRKVAREYLRQRNARGIEAPKSFPERIEGWECVAISLEELES